MSGALDFPASPAVGAIYNGTSGAGWLWDGTKWIASATSGGSSGGAYLPLVGGTMQGPITLPGNAATSLQAVPLQQLHLVSVLDYGAKGDGTTNDTAAIQNVLNIYAGKAVVLIPDTGHPYMTSGITLPTGTDLIIHGTIMLLANSTTAVVGLSSVLYCTIRGTGIIDGNKANQNNQNWTLPLAGIAISVCAGIRVLGITIQNTSTWAMNVTQSNNVVFDGVTVTGSGSAPEFAAQCDSCWLTNCILDGTGCGDYVFCFYGGITNSGAIGNIMRNGGAGTNYGPPGIGVLSDTGQPLACHNIVIANNITYNNNGSGIAVIGSGTSNITTGVVISNNRSYNNNKNPSSNGVAGADIFVDYAQDITITGNSISANGAPVGPYYTGIFIGQHCQGGFNITNNQIFNIGAGLGAPATGSTPNGGMYLQNPTDCYVGNNHIYDSQPTHTMQYSITGGVLARSSFIGNHFEVPFSCLTSPDTVFANVNWGVFSIGSVAQMLGGIALASAAAGNNLISFNTTGVGPPSFTTSSVGTKLLLYPGVTSTSVDYAIGMASATLWSSVPVNTTTNFFSWFGGTTEVATLDGTGNFTLSGNLLLNGTIRMSGANWSTEGGLIGWNYAGNGMTNFINSRGLGVGGFSFYNVSTGSSNTPVLLATIDNAANLNLQGAGVHYNGLPTGNNAIGFNWTTSSTVQFYVDGTMEGTLASREWAGGLYAPLASPVFSGVLTIGTHQVVGPQIAGWGTPTGGTRTASFPGASATLAQTAATLAQLILDMKTHGLLGA